MNDEGERKRKETLLLTLFSSQSIEPLPRPPQTLRSHFFCLLKFASRLASLTVSSFSIFCHSVSFCVLFKWGRERERIKGVGEPRGSVCGFLAFGKSEGMNSRKKSARERDENDGLIKLMGCCE